jgi:hypothetical protein
MLKNSCSIIRCPTLLNCETFTTNTNRPPAKTIGTFWKFSNLKKTNKKTLFCVNKTGCLLIDMFQLMDKLSTKKNSDVILLTGIVVLNDQHIYNYSQDTIRNY